MLGFWLNAVTALMDALMYAIEMGIINEKKKLQSQESEREGSQPQQLGALEVLAAAARWRHRHPTATSLM